MIRNLCAAVLVLVCATVNAQIKVKQVVEDLNPMEAVANIGPDSVIKDVDGNRVPFDDFVAKMSTGTYGVDPVSEDGAVAYFKIRKATLEELTVFEQAMNQKANDLKGNPLNDFKVVDTKGNTIDTARLRGKVLVLSFWFATCPPCIAEVPIINKLYDKYKDNDQVVFAAITHEDKTAVAAFLEAHPLKLPIVANSKNLIDKLGVNAFPTNMVIGKDGAVHDIFIGGVLTVDKRVGSAIEKLLK